MKTEHEASRTLVKSPPELWAECSDAGSLARHLGEFGDITITRLEPETTVAWEGEHASGTVRIEPSGWGTRVTLTAQALTEVVEPPIETAEATPEEENHETVEETPEAPDPALASDPGAVRIRWRRMTNRMRGWFGGEDSAPPPEDSAPPPEHEAPPPEALAPPPEDPAPPAEAQPDPPPEPSMTESDVDPEAILTAALDSLGQAHHRPFSRA